MVIKKLLVTCLVLCCCLLAMRSFGLADLSTSELIKVEGKVEVRKGQAPTFKAVPGNLQLAGALKRLDGGDKVRTAAQSGAELMLKDTCVLAVKEGSLFEVPLVLGEKGIAELKAQEGNFLFKVVSGSDFQVQTADVVAAVKGTLFEVDMTDTFQGILKMPGVELGIDNVGGTMVDVYEGEVALTNHDSKVTKTLKAGEGISVFNRLLMRLDSKFASGFSDVRKFNPLDQVQKNFGRVGAMLSQISSARQGFAGLNTAGLGMNFQRARMGGRVERFMEGFAPALRDKLGDLQEKLGVLNRFKGQLQEMKGSFKGLQGEPFKPQLDTSKFPLPGPRVIIPEQAVVENHLGDGLFVAAGPLQGCQVMRLVPEEGSGLVLEEGEGTFHIRDFVDKLEAIVSFQPVGDQVVTVVEVLEGTLYARLEGELGTIPITARQKVAFALKTGEGVGTQLAAVPGVGVNQRVVAHQFRAESEIARQKAEHDQKTAKQRQEAVKQILNTAPNRPAVKDKIKGKLKGLKLW